MTEKIEKEIEIEAKQTTSNLIAFMKELDTEANKKVKELELDIEFYKSEIEELKKWKDEWQEQVQKATDEGYARTLQTMQLSKAKELLKGWLGDFYNPKAFYQQRAELVEQSEQFLKE